MGDGNWKPVRERETEMLMKIKSRNEDQSLQKGQFLRVIRDLGGLQ